MKNKTVILIFSLIAFVSICFTACENMIIKTWWVKEEPEKPNYITLLKYIPEVTYDTLIEEKVVYETVFVQLPPETVYETVYVDKYIEKPVYQIVYEQLPPEVIYQVITETVTVPEYITNTVTEYVQIPPSKDTIIQWLQDPSNEDDVKEVIKKIKELYPNEFIDYIYEQLPPEIIYQVITETVSVPVYITNTVYETVIDYIDVPTPPTKETIIDWLKDPANENDAKEIIEKVKEMFPDEFIDYIYVQLPPEIIYQVVTQTETVYVPEYITNTVTEYVQIPPDKDTIIKWLKDPANADETKEIIRTIKEQIPEDVIKEIIKEIPPQDIMEYLTDEQIQYIVKQQPPQKILQSIKIIGIEYVLFAGDSSVVNGPHGPAAQTNLTDQEMAYNTSTIEEMAKLLNKNPTYIAMLHGHANPVTFTEGETGDLKKLSIDRATDVRRVLLDDYNKLPVNPDNSPFDDRVSTSGYGGEKVLFGNNTTYTALNRRVEMILFEIVTTVE